MGLFGKSKSVTPPPHVVTFAPNAVVSATFKTSLGQFTCRLFAKECPMTVGNFVGLATGQSPWTNRQGQKMQGTPLYRGAIFHRVIANFMIQGGDPEGTGRGGPGYQFSDEIVSSLKHNKPGILSMANAGPDTNGSQFFITDVPTPHLDGKHTVFGEVTSGLDIVQKIARVPCDGNDRPKTPVTIENIDITIG